MKLTNIVIENLFSYNGRQEINFDGITCIIGTNGFGKTSILNSIKLALGYANIPVESILNNNAQTPNCSVLLVFDVFTIERKWRFADKVEELFSVVFTDGTVIEGVEAEHFIHNKLPSFLVDFLFYDGEIGGNLFLLSRTRLKQLFDFVFDLDLLVNVQRDAIQVAKNLLEKNKGADTYELIELENKCITMLANIQKDKELLSEKTRESKALELNIQKLDTQIRNRSRKIKELHAKQDSKKIELDGLSLKFKEIIMFQMPLLLNKTLLKKMQQRTHSPLVMNDEKLFINHFKRFLDQIQTQIPEDEVLGIFKDLMLTESSSVKLSMSPKEFAKLLEDMKNLQYEIGQLQKEIETAEVSGMEQEIMRSLTESKEQQQYILTKLQHEIEDIESRIAAYTEEHKIVNRELTQSFKANQEKFAFIKSYEELQQVAQVSEIVYKEELQKKLTEFNGKLKKNTESFLKQYKHINEIFINEKHEIVVSDGQKRLDLELLSAGQKQVLNFLLVKSILEFRQFVSFVMIDTPFGRLSTENKKLLFRDCYLKFDHLILLLTDSEFEFVESQKLIHDTYYIRRNELGSKIEKAS